MKILMVAIPSLHFFRWTEQLKDSGHEVFWFDVTGMSKPVEKINWVSQKVNWKLKKKYPGRIFIKKKFPKLHNFIQQYNEHNTAKAFEAYLLETNPDVVHSFAMQLSCLPILDVMKKYHDLKWIFSSWGSDVYYSKELGINQFEMTNCFKRIDYLITDCQRDYEIALEKGFTNEFLGVFVGNGGIDFNLSSVEYNTEKRKVILIKGYNDGIGRGINIIKALDNELISLLEEYEVVIFGADAAINNYIAEQPNFKKLRYKLHLRSSNVANADLVDLMGKSYIYIANSLSDGIPNALIEAMGMGAFPIQSNPGNVTEEIIEDGINGFLINDSEDIFEIKSLVIKALNNKKLIANALLYNKEKITNKYQRAKVRENIIDTYEKMASQIN